MASEQRSYWTRFTDSRIKRRHLLRGLGATSAGVIALSLVGCGGDDDDDDSGNGGGGTGPTNGGTSPTQAAGDSGQPKPGGVLKASIGTTYPTTFDAHQEIFYYSLWPITMMYSQLLKFDEYEKEKIVTDLATSYEVPEPTRLIFKLPQTTFHDGTPLTSADVKASIERIKDPPQGVRSPRQAQFDLVASMDTPDDQTVVFNMARPSASFLGTLAHMNAAIFATKDMEDTEFHKTNVNGTGPFMLERADTGTLVVLRKNPNYHRDGLPYLDGWEWNVIPEAVANLAAFQSGNLDMYGPSATDIEQLQRMDNVTILQEPGTTWYATTIATQKAPWNDPRIWKAVGLAISKQDYNQVGNLGQGGIGGPVPPGSEWSLTEEELLMVPGYKGLGDGKESDMEARWAEARRLFDAAGIAEGTPARVLSWSNFENWAIVFKDGLERAGLSVELELVELGVYNERLTARDFGDMAANSRTAVFPDPTPVFADNYIVGAGRHYTDLVIPEVEELFPKQDAELDAEARFDLQHRMQLAYLETYPAEIYCTTVTDSAYYDHVKNFGVEYNGLFQGRKREEVWLDRA